MQKRIQDMLVISLMAMLISACGGATSETGQTQTSEPTTESDVANTTTNTGQDTEEKPEEPNSPQIMTNEEVAPPPEPKVEPKTQPKTDNNEPNVPAPQPRLNLPPANTLTLELKDPRIFEFSWRPMRGITHFTLFEKLSDSGEFVVMKDNISPIEIDFTIELPLLTRANASYKLQACTEDGCTDSNIVHINNVDADLHSAIGNLTSDNNDNFDRFGRAVSISGDGTTIAVGSPFADVLPIAPGFAGDDTGTVTIYEKNTETLKWQEVAYIVSPGGANSYFGRSLQLNDDGTSLAIGANGVNSVYIYEKRGDFWIAMARVQPPQPESGDNFGYSVAINDQGNRIIVGAHGEDSSASGEHNNDLEDSGAAYIFSRTERGFSWNQIAHLKASNADENDEFGWSVDMNGNLGSTVVVGAPREDSNSLGQYSDAEKDPNNNDIVNSGAAYIFSVVITDRVRWEQQSYLKASFPRAGNFFGYSVAIADFQSIVAVGAPHSSKLTKDGSTQAGLVYTYEFVNSLTSKWRFDNIISPRYHEDGDLFGHSLSFNKNGDSLAIGAPGESGYASGLHYFSEITAEDGLGNENSGAAYIFEPGTFLGQAAWTQSVYIRQPHISFGNDSFGFSIGIDNSADTLVVGQPGLQLDGSGRKKGSAFIY